ncbi:MAG: ComEC/Rec2 family competence protein, partial [Clostridiales bacterium]|nr:ComEC/Rec2 family competence protein [Clostridiales bacterium]
LLPTMQALLISKTVREDTPEEYDAQQVSNARARLTRIRLGAAESFAVTLAASFGVMPLIGYYFYNISVVGWLISPLFVIGAGLTVLLCFAAALIAVFSVTLATLPLFAADIIMRPLMAFSSFSVTLPGAYIASGQTPLLAVALFYAFLLALPPLAQKRRHPRLFILFSLPLLVLLLSFAPAVARPSEGQLEVVFIDVGQGDATLIITPLGQSILIDGGGSRLASGKVGENALLPYLRYRGLKRIDLLFSTHPDADHIDGLLTVLENMQVGQLLYAGVFTENVLQQRMLELARQQGVALTPAYAGQRFVLGPELSLYIVNPPAGAAYSERDNNAGCLSGLLSYGDISFLFTGDASFEELALLPPATIVKIPHHGSKGAYDEEAYALLPAEAAVISVGRDNSYGHPAGIVVEYWQERASLFRTDINGAVTIKSDGKSWRAGTFW